MRKKSDKEFLDDKSRALLRESFWGQTLILLAVAALIAGLFIWAAFGTINEHIIAPGKVIPSSQVQEIQNLEGGIIKKIFVREGDIVEKGQLLIQLDEIQYDSALKKEQVRYYTFLAKKIRLEAEVNNQDQIQFPNELKEKFPELVANEAKLFQVNRNNFHAKINSLTKSYQLAKKQLDMTEPLVKRGVLPQFDLLKIERETNDLKGKIDIERESYFSEAGTKLTDTRAELDGSEKQIIALKDRIDRSSIVAPLRGVVKNINFDTIGSIVKTGETILEIVPIEDHLLIEAKVVPRDVGFINIGQKANIKITAYDPTIYGGLEGKVTHISADSIKEVNEQGQQTHYFRVIVRTDVNYIEFKGKKLSITPGMECTVDIRTGERTILQFILKPLIRATQNVSGKL